MDVTVNVVEERELLPEDSAGGGLGAGRKTLKGHSNLW